LPGGLRNSAEEALNTYLRHLLQQQKPCPDQRLRVAATAGRGAVRRFLQGELPEMLSRLDPVAREVVCAALLEFCASRWPLRRIPSLHSYACPAQYPSPGVDEQETFTWPVDGQYYVNRAGTEYYIHRDLLGFLRRELRCYAVEHGGAILSHLPALFHVGDLLFQVLDQVEEHLCADFEQPGTIDEVHYCLPLVRIPLDLQSAVLASASQRREWQHVHGIAVQKKSADDVAQQHPMLPVDTRHMGDAFVTELRIRGVLNKDTIQGVLVQGDNMDAMRVLLPEFRETARCIYLDPPYNTGTSGFLYRDRYGRSSWLSMMDNRLELAREFLLADGSVFAQIDYAEKERLRFLLDRYFTYQTEIIWRIGWISGFKGAAKKFIRNHDTIYHYSRSASPFFQKRHIPYPRGYVRRDGSPPVGKGYPLEDTWNCSDLDRLDSIQIMSFSREKVGARSLTQKNENLLERIIGSTTVPGDTVMDFFAGTGTTCAVAHKMGRRWVGIECGDWFTSYTLPRMKRVLGGDPYGISPQYHWKGGGMFCYMRLSPRTGNRRSTSKKPHNCLPV
jgi:DNA modification methylase